ncbi:MAG TPA: DNA recombination protein RmuC [Candidatus Dormibacteraeota bacterium]|nr:DNA recombination protein RmuC [Candidatus Dormibacteraeota bacterium]
MPVLVWIAGAVIVIVIVAAIIWSAGAGRRAEQQIAATRQELQSSLATQTQGMSAQLNQLMQSVTQQLGQVRQELQAGVASSGQLATEAQREVARRLQSSTDQLIQMSQQIGEVQKSSQDLSQAAQTLQSVLGGAKTRGTLGEVTLERLLTDALPRNAYEMQYRFASTGAVVDAIVRGGERLLPVDSKFPLEAYRRLAAEGDAARREFSVAVRKHADSIAEKYILPEEHTLDYALMFVPSEGVYYELLLTEDTKYGLLDEYCRGKRVFPVSPNTFCACLGAIAVSLQGHKIEENARHLLANLAGLKKQLETFGDVYEKLGTHLRHAQQSYEDADSRLSRARNSVEQLSQGTLPEGASKVLEATLRD